MPHELCDKRAIHEVELPYCRALDRKETELLRGCYHHGAVNHYSGFEDIACNFAGPSVAGATNGLSGFRHVDRFERRDRRIAERRAVREFVSAIIDGQVPLAPVATHHDRPDVKYGMTPR